MAKDLLDYGDSGTKSFIRHIYEEAEAVLVGEGLKINLISISTEDPLKQIDIPEITQPLILVTSFAASEVLRRFYGYEPSVVAGHSLGQYAALTSAGSFSLEQAVRLVHLRGKFMAEAGRQNPGGMAVISGLPLADIEKVCQRSKAEIANRNSQDQTIISGSNSSLDDAIAAIVTLRELRENEKIKARRLRGVTIAAHSSLMEPARRQMEEVLQHEIIHDPSIPFAQNATGKYTTTAKEVRDGLRRQITDGVDWLNLVRLMYKNGIKTYIDVGPGDVLAGLIEKIEPGASVKRFGEILSKQ